MANYTINGWAFGLVVRFTEAGWIEQDFSAGGVIGAFEGLPTLLVRVWELPLPKPL